MITLDELKEELKPYKGTLVIGMTGSKTLFEVVKLIDVVDGGDDYYWVYDGWKGLVHASAVGRWIPLKGIIKEEYYDYMVKIWNLNNIEKSQ